LEEAGFKGMVLESWYGALVPLNTPASIIERLNTEIGKVLADPATRDSFLQTATEPVGGIAPAFARVMADDSAKYARLARELNIKIN
jgi:tripartite-type tricarboxylate transporter receptor subunit TctC